QPWLDFAYVDGLRDGAGFGHLLYVARSRPPHDLVNSVWRLDLAPDGRVIWLEPVFFVSTDARPLGVARDAPQAVATKLARSPVAGPGDTLGVVAADGTAYYLLERARTILSVGVTTGVDVMPGGWTFGDPITAGFGVPGGDANLAPADARLLQRYQQSV